MSSPLSSVLAQIGAGTPTVAEIARNTGLGLDLVRSALDHLIRTGRIEASEVPIGCPSGGCAGCGLAAACGQPGRRLVSLQLVR